MVKWLLCGAAMISGIVIAAETENRSFQFGNFEVIAVQDALSAMWVELFPGMSEEEFLRLTGGGRVPSSVNVFLLKRGDGKIILVDAGNGGKRGGMLRKLEQSGVFPESVDFILLTHMHGDHIGGLLGKHGEAVFSRALVYVSMPEWEFWQNGTAGPQGKQVRKVLHAYGSRVRTFRFGEEVLPGIKALDASGHTPGHTVFETDSLLIVGDLLHAAALQIPRPEVCTIYDMNPSGAVQARRRFYEFAASSSKPVAGMHLPYPGIGRIGRSAAGYVYLPGK